MRAPNAGSKMTPRSVEPGQYVFVVCSTGADYFPEMAAISIATLRIASPHARICVLTDRETSRLSTAGLSAIRDMADSVTAVDCAADGTLARSRFLKCNMRGLVDGPLFYLDSDTIIMRPLDTIWAVDCDVGASPNLGLDGKTYPAAAARNEIPASLDWTFGPGLYLNAGVIYLADNPAAHRFAEQYRASWREFIAATGRANEQFAFNRALAVTDTRVTVLPSSYNAQISMNVMALRGARIVHYFSGHFESSDETVAHVAAKRLRSEGVVDMAALRAEIASGNPWMQTDSYRKALATGSYWKAGTLAFTRVRKRLGVAA